MEPLLKRNKTNKQYSARLTRWLDTLNHFDISLKHTAGKEIKFTNFISSNPTETAEAEENYEEDFVINAIAQLATVNGRVGRIFDQSENSHTANMHDTRYSWTGTRYSKTNTNHFNLTANQINNTIHDNRNYHTELTMDNNNNNRQIPDRFALNDKLKYHWGADDEIMKIINRRDNSPETQELVERRIELTRPGHMRHHGHKKLEKEILLPRRPDEVDRKEIKRIDIRLRRKEENRVTHIEGGYFKNFGDKIPQASGTSSEINTETVNTQKHTPDTESTVSSTPEEQVITEEPGSYPAIPVQDYRKGPIEVIAVHYVRINKVIEPKAPRNRQQEDNIRAAEPDFMLDLETLIKETAADPDLIEVQCCIEDNNTQAIPDDYKQVAKKLTHRWGITMADDRIIIPKSLRYAALNALHFGHSGINKMCNDAVIFWWPNMRADIEKKAKTCSACLNAGKNLKTQLPSTEKLKLEPPKYPGEEIQIDFTGNLNSKHLDSSPFILVAVDKNSRWPVAKMFKNTNHDTVITFLREYINVYGVPKTIKSDNGSDFISKEYKSFCKEYNNIIRKYGTPNLHTGTGLVERAIQSLMNLTKTNLEETQNLRRA